MVDGPDELQREWFTHASTVGVTAGASAPEVLVQQVVERLRAWGGQVPMELKGIEETVVFGLPKALRAREAV
jgi:4-hydroxy-3-methylbut-2-enyl diphosphate reductase